MASTGGKNSDEIPSIRRESFIQAYGIQELEEYDSEENKSWNPDDDDAGSGGDSLHRQSSRQHRHSLTIDDIEDIDVTTKQNNTAAGGGGGGSQMDVSLLDSFASNSDMNSERSPTSGSGGGSSGRKHNQRGSQDSSLGGRYNRRGSQDSSIGAATPPNFAGGTHRRRGSQARRMRQRLGMRDSLTDNRRASTSTLGAMSIQESFGEMSLQSFTSLNSFSTTADGGESKEVGNLVFVTDAEMGRIMYGDDYDPNNTATKESLEEAKSRFARRQSSNGSYDASVVSTLSSSLPPSATLGIGAFSTVRLAWRRTPDVLDNIHETDERVGTTSFQDINREEDPESRGSRRSIVRVESTAAGPLDPTVPLESKGELVAVKIIQKSILKQMKTIQRGENNRVTVLTAYDNIEREIATMKRLQHPNLVRLFEVIDSVESDRLHMVLEYVSLGTLCGLAFVRMSCLSNRPHSPICFDLLQERF